MIEQRGGSTESFRTKKLFVVNTAVGFFKNRVSFVRNATELMINRHNNFFSNVNGLFQVNTDTRQSFKSILGGSTISSTINADGISFLTSFNASLASDFER